MRLSKQANRITNRLTSLYINQQPIYKLVRLTISSQHIHVLLEMDQILAIGTSS